MLLSVKNKRGDGNEEWNHSPEISNTCCLLSGGVFIKKIEQSIMSHTRDMRREIQKSTCATNVLYVVHIYGCIYIYI